VSDETVSMDGQDRPATGSQATVVGPEERPELAVGGAFVGGLVLAMILKRLAR
jgi:hypothetical protein